MVVLLPINTIPLDDLLVAHMFDKLQKARFIAVVTTAHQWQLYLTSTIHLTLSLSVVEDYL
jgi:hypothetical protein